MGRTVTTITQYLNETEAMLAAFRRSLRRSDQYIFDGIFASARKHITAISQSDALLPFETVLLAVLLEQAKDLTALQHELEQLRRE
ncbi:MAG TPA: hypothetical protein PLV64_23715 [Anaerolineales bacterium]|nr:hypothetical protein [Anaerolineales bacterium]